MYKTSISDLLSQGVPFKAAMDYKLVSAWMKIPGKTIDPSWQKRYEDIRKKYNLK